MFNRVWGHMVVGFTTTYAIGAYHNWCCWFKSRSGKGVQHYVIKFVSVLWQVGGFLRVLRFPPTIKLTAMYDWNIVGSGVKHHKTNQPITNNTHIFKKTIQRLVIFGIRIACPGRYRDYCCSNKQQSIFNLACKNSLKNAKGVIRSRN